MREGREEKRQRQQKAVKSSRLVSPCHMLLAAAAAADASRV